MHGSHTEGMSHSLPSSGSFDSDLISKQVFNSIVTMYNKIDMLILVSEEIMSEVAWWMKTDISMPEILQLSGSLQMHVKPDGELIGRDFGKRDLSFQR